MAQFIVAVSDSRHKDYEIERNILREAGAELVLFNCASAEDIVRECGLVDGILLDMAPMNAEAVAGLKKCRVINRYGVGYDNVDVEACTKKGIQVTYVPDYCAEDVSDHALALLFSCLRQVPLRDRLVRKDEWNIHYGDSLRVAGKTLGVLGFGRIARAFIRKVSGFGLARVLVYDPYVSSEDIVAMGAQKASYEETLKNSDFLSLHMPVTNETRGMINADALKLMKKSAILINTGRGLLVDDAALIAALQKEQIAFAGLDTHATEPLPPNSPYKALDNVVLTDHTAYNTLEGVEELKTKSAQNIADVLQNRRPAYCVNSL